MNEAIENFNAIAKGESSIKVDAIVPNSELFKIAMVLFLSYLGAFLITAIIIRK
tara:strand:- start:5745 stop:5906 length:162 start_codon:yes stop_codon:yes gene_type:complete